MVTTTCKRRRWCCYCFRSIHALVWSSLLLFLLLDHHHTVAQTTTTPTLSSSQTTTATATTTEIIPDILILIATQSFTAEDLVEDILLEHLSTEQQYSHHHWTVQVALVDEAEALDWNLDEGQQQQSPQSNRTMLATAARVVLIVASTYADGDPPNHAVPFAAWLQRLQQRQQQHRVDHIEKNETFDNENVNAPTTTPSSSTTTTPFAVFALGDSSYEHYCAFGKVIDQALLQQKGMTRLLPLHTGDAQVDQSGAFRAWSEQVTTVLPQVLPNRTSSSSAAAAAAASAASLPLQQTQPKAATPFHSTGADWRRSALQPDCRTATLVGKDNLLTSTSLNDRSAVMHISLQLPTSAVTATLLTCNLVIILVFFLIMI